MVIPPGLPHTNLCTLISNLPHFILMNLLADSFAYSLFTWIVWLVIAAGVSFVMGHYHRLSAHSRRIALHPVGEQQQRPHLQREGLTIRYRPCLFPACKHVCAVVLTMPGIFSGQLRHGPCIPASLSDARSQAGHTSHPPSSTPPFGHHFVKKWINYK